MILFGVNDVRNVARAKNTRAVVDQSELDRGVPGRSAHLETHHVLVAARDDDVAGPGEHAHRDLVRHDARRYEDRLGLGDHGGESLLEFVDRGILVVTHVTDLRARHGFAHRGCGLGHRVTSQVDQSRHKERLPSVT